MRIVLLLVAGMLLAEVGLRVIRYLRRREGWTEPFLMPPPKAFAFTSHPYALVVKRPDCGGMFPSNSLGYAGKREFVKGRSPNSLRVYCIGDSTTERHERREGPNSSWPAKLEFELSRRFPDVKIECINAGVSGYTTAESLIEFMFRGLDLRPDIVLVFHNINDALTCQMVEGFKSDYSHVRVQRLWLLELLKGIPDVPYLWTIQIVRRFAISRFGNIESILYWISRQPPWETAEGLNLSAVEAHRRNLFNLTSLAIAWGCVPVLIKFECDWDSDPHRVYYLGVKERISTYYYQYLTANNDALRALGQTMAGSHYLDVGPFESRHFSDTIHFNGEGTSEMARRVADGLEPIVRNLQNRSMSARMATTNASGC